MFNNAGDGNLGAEAWGGPAQQQVPNGVPEGQPQMQAPTPDAPDTGADDMRRLLSSIVNIGAAAGNAHQEQLITRHALEALVQRIEALSASAPAPAVNHSAVHAPTTPGRGSIKVRDPRVFNGKSSEVDAFVDEVEAAIELQPALRDAEEIVKCRYFASWFGDGAPRSWLKAMRTRDEYFMEDYMNFVYEFRKRFEDSDQQNKMINKIESLHQEGSAAAYANQFEEYRRYIDWSESYAIKRFEKGLKPELRMQLLGRPRPTTLSEWIPVVVDLDNELFNLRADTKGKSLSGVVQSGKGPRPGHQQPAAAPTLPAPSSRPPPTPAAASNGVVPMEVDAVRHGKLTPQERKRRFDNDLCLYCGEGSHRLAQCPARIAKDSKAAPSKGKA